MQKITITVKKTIAYLEKNLLVWKPGVSGRGFFGRGIGNRAGLEILDRE